MAQVGRDQHPEVDRFAGGVVFLQDLPEGMDPGEGPLFGDGDGQVELGPDRAEAGAEFLEQFGESFARVGRDGDGAGEESLPALKDVAGGQKVHLVEDHQGRTFCRPDLTQDGVDGPDLFLRVRMAHIDDVEQQVGFHHLLQRRLEGFDEAVWQFADEPHGVAQQDVLIGGKPEAAGGGIQRREQFVLGQDRCPRQGIEQGGLTGIGVAHDRSQWPLMTLASVALGQPLATDDVEFIPDPFDPFLGLAAIGFELGFAFTTDGTEAPALSGKVGPEAGQARKEILELGELDLELAFPGAGALGEDLQNEGGAIQDLAAKDLLQIPRLGTGELVVEDDCIDAQFLAAEGKLGGLAGPDSGGGVRRFELLGSVAEDPRTHRGGQFTQFVQGITDVPRGSTFEFETDQERFFGTLISSFDECFQRMEWTRPAYRRFRRRQGVAKPDPPSARLPRGTGCGTLDLAMPAEILSTHTPLLFQGAVARAVELLRAGEVVALPTETVYGLAANAWDSRAVARIFEVKGRPSINPLIVHVADGQGAMDCAAVWPEMATRLATRFWPGPLTLVVPRGPRIPDGVTGGGDTVGIRWPFHPFMQAVIRACGFPLAAPSANLSNQLSPSSASHVIAGLGQRIPLIVDGGDCNVGIESTVVDVTGPVPRILRPGMISLEEIADASGCGVALNAGVNVAGALRSPGMLEKHYSPRARLVVWRWSDDLDLARQLRGAGVDPSDAWILTHTRLPTSGRYPHAMMIPAEPEAFARALYAELHRCDEGGARMIVVEAVPEGSSWDGISDRLRRAGADPHSGLA